MSCDEAGLPIGMAYRKASEANLELDMEDQFEFYLFTKNLQGDILNVYSEDGTKVASYNYDAWGNHTVTNYTSDNIGNLNPFRYRGYYFDSETNFYYLNSRYYSPKTKRFLNADVYISTGTGLLGYNMYAYCNNNPVMYTDNSGDLPDWLKTIIDIGCYIGSAATSIAIGCYVAKKSKSVATGISVGVASFGIINNATNFIYYSFISDGETDIHESSYNKGYVNRWDRLDYTKKKLKEAESNYKYYNIDAWRYYSEYNLHMYGWGLTGWALDKDIYVVSKLAKRAQEAHVVPGQKDNYWYINAGTFIIGILGL